jgi:hypothetical protein
MSSNQGFITIDNIVRKALADKGENTTRYYPRYLHYALTMMRKLNLDVLEDIKTVRIPVTARNTVPYPEDFITYSKIGIKVGDRMLCFNRDNTLTKERDDNYTKNGKFYDVAQDVYGGGSGYYHFYNYVDNSGTYSDTFETYGYAHNSVGYFKEDPECREFILSSEVSVDSVVLEYIANVVHPDSETLVPVMAEDTIKEYIHFQHARFSKSVGVGERQLEEKEYLEELANLNMRLSDLSYQGIIDTMRRQQTLAPKL